MQASAAPNNAQPLRLKVAGMDCGSCALTIENSMRQLPGVASASVSFTTETLELTGQVQQAEVEARLRELGYRLADAGAAVAPLPSAELHGAAGFLRFLWAQPRLRVALLIAAAVLVGMPLLAGAPRIAGVSPLDLLFALAVLVTGAPIFSKGVRALVFARRITIDLLMAVASLGALAIGATGEAATVVLLFTLGEALEAYSAERARGSLRSLMSLQPQEATVLREHHEEHGAAASPDDHADCTRGDHEHGHEHQLILPVAQIAIGATVLVRPGQRIPVDGVVLRGESTVNQATVTGESEPVPVVTGEAVMAGTVNGESALEVRVTRAAGDATIARIARLVEQAQAQRSPAERFIDRFARWYTPAVVAIAVLMVMIPVYVLGQPLLDSADGSHGWLYRALSLLIIACPCALVISIPVTVVSSLTRLANLGVLVKGGAQLDRLADVRAVAFDKTGTLTRGRPAVTSVRTDDCAHEAEVADACEPCDDVVALAASVERASEHPVAHAIVTAAKDRDLQHRYDAARAVKAVAGRGVIGESTNGERIGVGTEGLHGDATLPSGHLNHQATSARETGQTVMYVSRAENVIGYIGVQDEVREASRTALAELDAAEPPVAAVMLTGDNAQVAARVAERIGHIDDVRAGLLPEQKLAAIEDLHRRYGTVAMVGDGINDAPALARADVGIAMGAGTAQAMETADVVLMQDDISHVPLALRLARRSRTLVKQNIALSLGLKVAFLALAIPGITTLWMAVLADVGATMLVTLNGMRVLRES
jgi:Cd2+/Zn2+-exporting ATPase